MTRSFRLIAKASSKMYGGLLKESMQKQNASIRIRDKLVCVKRCDKLMALKVHKRDKECMCSIKSN